MRPTIVVACLMATAVACAVPIFRLVEIQREDDAKRLWFNSHQCKHVEYTDRPPYHVWRCADGGLYTWQTLPGVLR